MKKLFGKIKLYFKNLPRAVKTLLYINLVVYLIIAVSDLIPFFDIEEYLGAHATNSERFHLYQIITSIFSHNLLFDHILGNMLVFLIFAPNVENKIGSKTLFLLYFFSGFIAFIFADNIMCEKYNQLIAEYNDCSNLPKDVIDMYKSNIESHINHNIGIGSSGAITGILAAFFILNLFTMKKIIYNLVVILLMVPNVIFLFNENIDVYEKATEYNHLGGFVGGLFLVISFLFFRQKEEGSLSTH
jgi:membrane associated rhomboid family serine protease